MKCKKCGAALNSGAMICPNCGNYIPIKDVIREIFNDARNLWEGQINNNYCYAYYIPERVQNPIKFNFGISSDEQLLYVFDNSKNDTRDQGLVLTNSAIHYIGEDPTSNFTIPWNSIKTVDYEDSVLYFKGYENPNTDLTSIHISYFYHTHYPNSSKTESEIGNAWADVFTQIAECEALGTEQTSLDEAIDKYCELLKQNKSDEALKYAFECKNTIENGLLFYALIADTYIKEGKDAEAISICNEGIGKFEINDVTLRPSLLLLYFCYSAQRRLGNVTEARDDCGFLLQSIPNDINLTWDDDIQIKDKAEEDFKVLDKVYSDNFLFFPYQKRKSLLPVNKYTEFYQKRLSVLNIQNLPPIEFPNGHPIANQLYVGHPFISNKYIPFENYEFELVKDKVREFCRIVQSLGATEITIESFNLFGSSSHYRNSRLVEEMSHSINLHQKFTPQGKPTLPQGLVWFPNESSWQRLYQQRMHGDILQYNERIETCNLKVIDDSELKEIKEEFKKVLSNDLIFNYDIDTLQPEEIDKLELEANTHWENVEEKKFALHENEIISIQVQFSSVVCSNPSEDISSHTTRIRSFSSNKIKPRYKQ